MQAIWQKGFMDWHSDLEEPEHIIDSLDEIIGII
jgi:hypothetical protein